MTTSFQKVTIEYTLENGACVPLRLHTVVVSVQHSEDISSEEMKSEIKEKIIKVFNASCAFLLSLYIIIIKAVVPPALIDDRTIFHIQPSGSFVVGGPQVNVYFMGVY